MYRIYHPFWKWEDHKAGFYDNVSGEKKKIMSEKVLEMFNSEKITRENMMRVIDEWQYSCEQNLSNESMNKIAYLGQAACCLYFGIPNTITMENWSRLDKEVQNKANKIANDVLNIWIKRNKKIQLCLNLD